jgi:hypothetical protein
MVKVPVSRLSYTYYVKMVDVFWPLATEPVASENI